MKKIQSRYILWGLFALFSMNVATPAFAAEPQKEKLSFVQRITLIRRAKELLKEWRELRKKVKEGTATEEEKKRWGVMAGLVVGILALLITVPIWVYLRRRDKKFREKVRRAERIEKTEQEEWEASKEETQVRWGLEDESAIRGFEQYVADEREHRKREFVLWAIRVIRNEINREEAIKELVLQMQGLRDDLERISPLILSEDPTLQDRVEQIQTEFFSAVGSTKKEVTDRLNRTIEKVQKVNREGKTIQEISKEIEPSRSSSF